MQHDNKTLAGFSLIELMITIAIIGILMSIALPSYEHHLTRVNRQQASIELSQLNAKMAEYFLQNKTYQGATLAKLSSLKNIVNDKYQLSISNLSDDGYEISAVPQGKQANRDTNCGSLSLDQDGRRGVGGMRGVRECW